MIIDARRLRLYPRIIAATAFSVIFLNMLAGSGWGGLFGKPIAIDFIIFYGSGDLFLHAPHLLYDYDAQLRQEQGIVAPLALASSGPFSHPPFFGALLALLARLPMSAAFVGWWAASLLFAIGGVVALRRLMRDAGVAGPLSFLDGCVVVLSTAPFLLGLNSGQTNAAVFFLLAAAATAAIGGRSAVAGFLSGLLAFKPQFLPGFVLLWLLRGDWRAMIGMCAGAGVWLGLLLAAVGTPLTIGLFRAYDDFLRQLVLLPYDGGFPAYLLATPFGFLASLLGRQAHTFTSYASWTVGAVSVLALAVVAWQTRHAELRRAPAALAGVLILPIVATPYFMMYDLVCLIPFFVVLSLIGGAYRELTLAAAGTYAGIFLLTFVSFVCGISLLTLLPLTLFLWWYGRFGKVRRA